MLQQNMTQALLGFTACQKLQLLRLVEENVCAVRMATASDALTLKQKSVKTNTYCLNGGRNNDRIR